MLVFRSIFMDSPKLISALADKGGEAFLEVACRTYRFRLTGRTAHRDKGWGGIADAPDFAIDGSGSPRGPSWFRDWPGGQTRDDFVAMRGSNRSTLAEPSGECGGTSQDDRTPHRLC
jgi:hypothetical protein